MAGSPLIKFYAALLVALCYSVACVYGAQLPAGDSASYQSKVVRYKSPVQLKVEALRASGTAGYMDQKYGAKSGPSRSQAAQRTVADCGNGYLCNGNPMPVTLISFHGSRIDAGHVNLAWETSSETNNQGFDVERSSESIRNFEKIAFVDGAGDSNKSRDYKLTDINAETNVTYYRLKQLDFDGTYEYSRIIAVQGFKEQFSVVAVPNPGSQQSMFLKVNGAKSNEVNVAIYNQSGLLMHQGQSLKLTSDNQIPLAQMSTLEAGLYLAKVIAGDQQATVTFVIAP
ncbi:T9SS type A sorting domain-containing protein [Dyadobacter sp. CY326]|uniref:T9SS type A sorting domain-containing protein n=1 Tax=Dyadobacter sp. CY326 TaxID=2907300 RepID=UPI001F165684|nr:T9SS type A sorting domain-containing protein [Dyadobacter sp. CY326]MCE7067076.1 T9SS type A sorting domain-containing protein [Dyadobacter sp. CY326]